MAKACFALRLYRRSSRRNERERVWFTAHWGCGERSSSLTEMVGNGTAKV